jgi:hypothetical protein
VDYAVAGGNAVALWLSRLPEALAPRLEQLLDDPLG